VETRGDPIDFPFFFAWFSPEDQFLLCLFLFFIVDFGDHPPEMITRQR